MLSIWFRFLIFDYLSYLNNILDIITLTYFYFDILIINFIMKFSFALTN